MNWLGCGLRRVDSKTQLKPGSENVNEHAQGEAEGGRELEAGNCRLVVQIGVWAGNSTGRTPRWAGDSRNFRNEGDGVSNSCIGVSVVSILTGMCKLLRWW